MKDRLVRFVSGSKKTAVRTPDLVITSFRKAVKEAPVVAKRVAEDVSLIREVRAAKKKQAAVATIDAAAEE